MWTLMSATGCPLSPKRPLNLITDSQQTWQRLPQGRRKKIVFLILIMSALPWPVGDIWSIDTGCNVRDMEDFHVSGNIYKEFLHIFSVSLTRTERCLYGCFWDPTSPNKRPISKKKKKKKSVLKTIWLIYFGPLNKSLFHRGEAMYMSLIDFQWTSTETKNFQLFNNSPFNYDYLHQLWKYIWHISTKMH